MAAPNASVNAYVMFKWLQKWTWEREFQLKKCQHDAAIIAPKKSQYGSIQCELGRDYKNGI